MTEISLGDRRVALPDLPRLDVSLPSVSLSELTRDLTLPTVPFGELPFRREPRTPIVPVILATLLAGLAVGTIVALIAWSFAPVRETAERIRGRLAGPSWVNGPKPEYLANAIAGPSRAEEGSPSDVGAGYGVSGDTSRTGADVAPRRAPRHDPQPA